MLSDPIQFLTQLSSNNNREWFDRNRTWYESNRKMLEALTDSLITGVRSFDTTIGSPKSKDCVFRIFRDTRFSNDKTPYKTNMGTFIARGGRKSTFAGYYLHLEPGGKSFAGGGLYMPPSDKLKMVREEIYYHVDEFKKILKAKSFVSHFKELDLVGDELKKAPQGYDPSWPDINLLKFKHYIVGEYFTDPSLADSKIKEYFIEVYQAMHPLVRFINRALEIPQS